MADFTKRRMVEYLLTQPQHAADVAKYAASQGLGLQLAAEHLADIVLAKMDPRTREAVEGLGDIIEGLDRLSSDPDIDLDRPGARRRPTWIT